MPVGMFDRGAFGGRLLTSLGVELLPDLSRLIGFPTSSTDERVCPGLLLPGRFGIGLLLPGLFGIGLLLPGLLVP